MAERAQGGHAKRVGDAPFVDLGVAGLAYGVGRAPVAQFVENRLAPMFGEHFGVGHAVRHAEVGPPGQFDGIIAIQRLQITGPNGGAPDHHRTGERAAADFIESSDKVIALGRKAAFQVKCRGNHARLPSSHNG